MWPFHRNTKKVKITINKQSITVSPKKTILASCLSQGIDLKSNCGVGSCQKCRYHLVSGNVNADRSPQGKMLACCTFPISDIEIISF